MKSSNKFYPHPVLGIEDNVIGDYKPKCYVEINRDFVILKIEEILLCQEMKKMIETKQAIFLTEVDCSRSMFRSSKKHSDMECEFRISSEELRGNVNVEFYILANTDMPTYKLDSFNKEYEGISFDIKRGDILAYGGKDNFYVEKKYKELDSAGSIITIGYYNKDEGPVRFDLEQDQINIMIPKKYFELYRNTINVDYNDIYNIHHSSIAFPALFHALSVVFRNMEESGKEMENCEFFKWKWCEQLSHEIKNHSELKKLPKTIEYAPAFAQALLDNPLSRTFVTIDKIIEDSKK